MPYTQTPEYPSHGRLDSTDDMTGGMGFRGLEHLQGFVESGGLLLVIASAGVLASDSGIAARVSSRPSAGTPGSHVTAKILRPEHPVTWGYPEITHVFHGNSRSYHVRDHDFGRVVMQYGTKTLAEAEADADRKADIEVRTPEPEKERGTGEEDPEPDAKKQPLCLSGLVRDPDKLSRNPAILDVPAGAGRVLFLTWNPLHRHQNQHDFAFLTNALLFHDDFPPIPTEEQMRTREEP